MNRNRFSLFVLLTVVVVTLAACAPRSGTAKTARAELPVDKAYADGQEIYFTHTEISNAEMAQKMTAAMESPVLYTPGLADVPATSQANVYLFTNGVKGGSMSGLQLSVFDNPPGADGYSPLRRLNMVTWTDNTQARELKSAAEVLAAAKAGEVTIKQSGVVANMPFIVWPGGKR